ncbi:MAG: SUF system Fe-S cluster assembly protein [Alphaproteobacteria bacterium]
MDMEQEMRPEPQQTETGTDKSAEVDPHLLFDPIVAAIKTVYDPEIPVDIYELGLIYRLDVNEQGLVDIDMTLTAPACPVAGEMPVWVRDAVLQVSGVRGCEVNMVFDPPWDKSRMSDEAQVALDMF